MIQDIASNTADFLDLIGDMNNPDIDEITIEISKKLAEWGVIHPEKKKTAREKKSERIMRFMYL